MYLMDFHGWISMTIGYMSCGHSKIDLNIFKGIEHIEMSQENEQEFKADSQNRKNRNHSHRRNGNF